MKVDVFTKTILTVIAINLSILTVKNLEIIPKAYANEPAGESELFPKANYGLIPLNEDGSINVRLSDVIDVNITEISTWDKLNVHLKSSDSRALQYAGPIDVDNY